MRWRVGNKLGRTIYRDDVLVGMLDDVDLARAVVDVLNAAIEDRMLLRQDSYVGLDDAIDRLLAVPK